MKKTNQPVEFRRMTTADVEGGLRLCRLSRWDQVARDWERFLAEEPPGATVAVRDGRVIGSSATIRYGDRFGWVGMVLVEPDARGEGLGTALLLRAYEVLQDLPAVRLDATPAGRPLYLQQGFVEECGLRRMEAAAFAGAARSRAGIEPMAPADLPEVLAMDLGVFGAPRGDLLQWMRAGAPEYAWVARRGGAVAGYALGRHGFGFDHLGPIVAADAAMAADLTTVCAAAGARALIVDATSHSTAWMQFLEHAGFHEQRPFIRMHRGGSPPFGAPERQFAVLGPEFG